MAPIPEPVEGNWYRTPEGERFEVVALDEDTQSIEVQYYGGEIDEFDFETWAELELRTIEPSEDWSAPYDIADRDDLGYTDTSGNALRSSLARFDRADS